MTEHTQTLDIPRREPWFWKAFIGILLVALVLRVYQIDLRPMHNDEGVNYHFFKETLSRGYYPYSHENYHGPLYFYLSTASLVLFGSSELAIRASAIICGLLMIVSLLGLRRDLGDRFVIFAATLITLSSSLVFYSRYAIHESLFALASLWFAIAAYRWWLRKDAQSIYWGMLAAAALITTKETFIVSFACIFCGFMGLGAYRQSIQAINRQWSTLFYGALILLLVVTFIFSGAFTWAGGIREMFLAVPQWVGRNSSDVGHFKPFLYYGRMLLNTEPQALAALYLPLLILLVYPRDIYYALTKGSGAFGRMSMLWGLASLLVYSLINYKTPWLVINVTLPLSLALAWWFDRLLIKSSKLRMLGQVSLGLALVVAPYSLYKFNFEIPYGNQNPYSYVHTSNGMLEVVRETKAVWARKPKAKVLIAVGGYWPLPYYYREFSSNVAYLQSNRPADFAGDYDVMIFDKDVIWNDPAWQRTYYRLSDVQEAQLYVRK